MGMNAELYAIGKFKKKIVSCLDYPENYYEGVKVGAKIATLIHACNNENTSKALFKAFDIEPWALGNHWIGKLDPDSEFTNIMIAFLESAGMDSDTIANMRELANAEFRFFLMPNG